MFLLVEAKVVSLYVEMWKAIVLDKVPVVDFRETVHETIATADFHHCE